MSIRLPEISLTKRFVARFEHSAAPTPDLGLFTAPGDFKTPYLSMKKLLHALLPGALALVMASPTQAGTYTSAGKGVTPTQPAPVEPCAGPISYSNIELLYAYTDWDNFGGNDHTNGAQLNIEFSPFQSFYLTAGAEWFSESDADLWILHAGIGGYVPLGEHFHLAVDGGALWTDLEFDNDVVVGDDNASDWGWYVRPHLRAKWGCFEAHAGALYRDMGDFNGGGGDGQWAGFAQLYYHITTSLDITAGVLCDEDFTQVTGGLRLRF